MKVRYSVDASTSGPCKKKSYYAYQVFMAKHSQCGDSNDIHFEMFYEGDPRFDSLDPKKEVK